MSTSCVCRKVGIKNVMPMKTLVINYNRCSDDLVVQNYQIKPGETREIWYIVGSFSTAFPSNSYQEIDLTLWPEGCEISVTPTMTPTVTPTITPTPSITPTVSTSSTSTPTPTPTQTPGASPSGSPTPTPTISETATSTPTPTPTISGTATSTPTPTPTQTPGASPSGSPTPTPTISETATSTPTPTPTQTPGASPSGSPTPTPTISETATSTPTNTPTPSASPEVSPTTTPTNTPTPSASPEVSPTTTPTNTPTPSASPEVSPTTTPTNTPTPSASPATSPTPTASITPTNTPTQTTTPTNTPTQTTTTTPTQTPTNTPSPTASGVAPSYFGYIFAEPQVEGDDTTLLNYATANGAEIWYSWFSAGVPSNSGGYYSNDLNVYAHQPSFINGTGNFIPPVDLSNIIAQTGGQVISGISQNQYTFGSIEVASADINSGIRYFYTTWLPLDGVGGTFTQMVIDVGTTNGGTELFNDLPAEPTTNSVNVVVTSGAAIPAGTYRVLWSSPQLQLPGTLPLSGSLYFRGDTKS